MPKDDTSSNEFFTTDDNGHKSDYWLHADLLDGEEGQAAERASRLATIERMRAEGVDESTIQALYGTTQEAA